MVAAVDIHRQRNNMRSLTRTVVLVLSSALVLMITPTPASATPAGSVDLGSRVQVAPVAVSAPAAIDPKALEQVPASVVRLVPGSPEFLVRYFGGNRSGFDPDGLGNADVDFPGQECSTRGGDVGLYAVDLVRRFGDVMQFTADASGETADYPTSPWPGSGWTESANMPFSLGYDDGAGSLVHIPNPKLLTACGADLAPFGQASPESPWGFDFFSEPDQGSVNAFLGELAATPARTGVLSGDQSWIAVNTTWEGTDFSPTDFMNYCTDALNPLCMTAMFLHCPESGDGAAQCQQFNVNTMKLNIALASWVVGNDDPQFNVWGKVLRAGRTLVTAFTVFAIVAGVLTVAVACVYLCAAVASALPVIIGVGRALLATGALKKIALVLAGIGVVGTGALGVIDCAASFGKCFAQWSGDGMIGALNQIPDAIKASSVPDLNSPAWSNLFNGIAGVATVLLIILFLIAVTMALLKGKPGEILPSIGGLIGFGVAVGLGGVLVTAMIVGRDAVTTALSGAGGPGAGSVGDVATLLAGRQTNTLRDLIDSDETVGLFGIGVLAFIGMLMGLVINMIVWLSNQWVALAIAIMLLQAAGMAGTAGPRKWVIRGLSALWSLLLAKPLMMLTFRVGDAMIATSTGFSSLMGGVIVLLSTVVVFAALPKLFSIGDGTPLGVGGTLKSGFDQALAYRARGGSGGRGGGASTSEAESRSARNRGTDGATGSGPAGGGPSGGGPISPLKQGNGGSRFGKAPAASASGAIGSAGSECGQSAGQGEKSGDRARELVGAGAGVGGGSGGQGLSDRPGPGADSGDASPEPMRGNGMQALAARMGADGGRHASGASAGNAGAVGLGKSSAGGGSASGAGNGSSASGSAGTPSSGPGQTSPEIRRANGMQTLAGDGGRHSGSTAAGGAGASDSGSAAGGGVAAGSAGERSAPGGGGGASAAVSASGGGAAGGGGAASGGGAELGGFGAPSGGGSASAPQSASAPSTGNGNGNSGSPGGRANGGAGPAVDGRNAPGTSAAPWAAGAQSGQGRPGASGRPAPRSFGPASGRGSWGNNNRRGK